MSWARCWQLVDSAATGVGQRWNGKVGCHDESGVQRGHSPSALSSSEKEMLAGVCAIASVALAEKHCEFLTHRRTCVLYKWCPFLSDADGLSAKELMQRGTQTHCTELENQSLGTTLQRTAVRNEGSCAFR